MTKYTTITHAPYPEDPEYVDPQIIGDGLSTVESAVVGQFTDAADRTTRWPTPPVGAVSFLSGVGKYQSYAGGASWVDLSQKMGPITTGQIPDLTQYVLAPPIARDGVKRLYRSDSDTSYWIQTTYDGSRFLAEAFGPTNVRFSGVRVERADSAANADNATNAATATTANNSNGLGGQTAAFYADRSTQQNMNGIYDFTNTSSGLRFSGIQTTGNAANVAISSNVFLRSTSSVRYKTDIEDRDIDWHPLLDVKSKRWKHTGDGFTYDGFIAEEVVEAVPDTAIRDADGEIDNWNVNLVVAGLVQLVKELFERVQTLESRTA